MDTNRKRILRWIAIGISIIALLASIGLYIVQRQFNLALQISVGLFIIGLAVFVVLDPDQIRRLVTGRQARYGSNAFIITLAFIGILVVINYLGYKNTKRWDLTADKSNTLAKETLDVLKSLPDNVVVKAFFSSDSSMSTSKESAQTLLDKYVYDGKGKFKYEFVDPNKDPVSAQDAGISKDGTIVLYMGSAKQSVTSVTETDLTGAMVRLMNPGAHVIYFMTGHGEYPTSGSSDQSYTKLSTALESKNYTVSSLNLLATAKIPQDASVVVIDGPKKPLSDNEVSLLDEYIKNGGSVVLMEDPPAETQFGDSPDPLATDLAQNYGITLGNNVVIDAYGNQAFQNYLFAIGYKYADHAITQNMTTEATGFKVARSVTTDDAVAKDYSKTQLVLTVDQSWGETNLSSLQDNSLKPDQGADLLGPVPLAVAAEDSSTNARLVVFGDSDFATNAYYDFYGNSDLIVNSIDWAAKQENLINLTPKTTITRTLAQPKPYTMNLILLGSLVVLPGLIIVAGVGSWVSRRRRG
jgi:gliding motility-associatede transport system auxiliary component